MRTYRDDDAERERDLDKREEQEPAHLHRESTPRPVRVFFFNYAGQASTLTVIAPEPAWRPSDGGAS